MIISGSPLVRELGSRSNTSARARMGLAVSGRKAKAPTIPGNSSGNWMRGIDGPILAEQGTVLHLRVNPGKQAVLLPVIVITALPGLTPVTTKVNMVLFGPSALVVVRMLAMPLAVFVTDATLNPQV